MVNISSISVVIPSRNEGHRLVDTIKCLLAVDPGSNVSVDEIIVVDDSSADESSDLSISDGRVQVVRNSAREGISRSRNRGARISTGNVIVWCDAHTKVHQGWGSGLVNALNSGMDVGAVSPGIAPDDGNGRTGFGWTWEAGDPAMVRKWLPRPSVDSSVDVPLLPGGFIATPREVFERTGGFDEGLGWFGDEDAEFSLRLWSIGLRCVVAPEVVVEHFFKDPSQQGDDELAMLVFNKLRLAHIYLPTWYAMRVFDFLRDFAAFPKALSLFMSSDSFDRGRLVSRERVREAEWFWKRFGLSNAFAKKDSSPAEISSELSLQQAQWRQSSSLPKRGSALLQ
ncbi:glycosyltransferase [Nonomuraea sp. NPDC050556]|uniref:glycosyltransferase n=1 Tax=Nonomuraea sp. NPDC050556 TaxID=3364369 RepID=UPI0037AC8DB9